MFCLHFNLLGIRIRIQEAPEYGSKMDPDPQHWVGVGVGVGVRVGVGVGVGVGAGICLELEPEISKMGSSDNPGSKQKREEEDDWQEEWVPVPSRGRFSPTSHNTV